MSKKRISVSISRTVNLGDFESVKAGVFIEEDVKDGVDSAEAFDALWVEAEGQVDNYLSAYEGEEKEETVSEESTPEPEEVETAEEVEEVEEEVGDEEVEEADLTEEDINNMTKKELIELCQTTEGLEEVDTSLNIKPLRAVLIDMLFEEEGNEEGAEEGEEGAEEGGDWEDEDWQDD